MPPPAPLPDEDDSPASPVPAESAPAPEPASGTRERGDTGCLLLLAVVFIGIFLLPAAIMLGGAAIVLPALLALLTAVLTPLLNPAEKMAPRARWTGRILVFLGIGALLGGAVLWVWSGIGGGLPRRD